MPASVPSPCIGLCILDPRTGFCKGCFRTIEEIGSWLSVDDDGRREILRLVFERRDSDVE
ncbi:MAG: DUF1289 domain-containing protein [Alphaproteobacteria bacterium]|nr:DUF1289 domain-containing protein [Alphaproteobacteria bacterium]